MEDGPEAVADPLQADPASLEDELTNTKRARASVAASVLHATGISMKATNSLHRDL